MDCARIEIDYLSYSEQTVLDYEGDFCMPVGYCDDVMLQNKEDFKMRVIMTCPKQTDWIKMAVAIAVSAAAVVAAVTLAVVGFGLLF